MESVVDQEGEKQVILPRILNEIADVVDKVSNTKLPISHGHMWILMGAAAVGVGVEERIRAIPRLPSVYGDWNFVTSDDVVSSLEWHMENGVNGKPMTDVLANSFLKSQIELYKEMVREKDFGLALTALGAGSMAVLGEIAAHARQPVKISEGVGRLPGVGEAISKSLRNLSKAVQPVK